MTGLGIAIMIILGLIGCVMIRVGGFQDTNPIALLGATLCVLSLFVLWTNRIGFNEEEEV